METSEAEEKIRRLEAQVFQLKNIIVKLTGQKQTCKDEASKGTKKSGKVNRPFDFTLYKKRHVLLHVAYFGWNLNGFAVQEITGPTVESHLFEALLTTKLIQSRDTSNYHRCGRTDKGVSAFTQVVSLDLRTNLLEGPGVFDYEDCKADTRAVSDPVHEIDYCKLLNCNLPPEIQVIAWAPCIDSKFSARFDCIQRTYKYFFPKGDMDIELIRAGGQKLVGLHDFRNLCKMDVANGVTNYHRSIQCVQVRPVKEVMDSGDDVPQPESPYSLYELRIDGKAFLWHQIRCIVAVLFRIGSGLESPEVIDQLLDVARNPAKPQYQMAAEFPLNLFHCQFETVDHEGKQRLGEWQYDLTSLTLVVKEFQRLWTEHSVRAAMIKATLFELESSLQGLGGEMIRGVSDSLVPVCRASGKSYVPLMQMLKCPTLEQKLDSSAVKRRKKH